MQVRCVECHEPIDVAEDTQFNSMTCPSCGSAFSLLGEETIAYDGKPGDDADFVVRTLGHFELVDLLGSGSFGSVWMARDVELDRTVAVKIPRKGQLNPEEAEQFLREARAAAQLQHPNIVAVHEVGRDDDTVYIVNDFVRGMPMDDWIAEQQLTQREAAEICAKIADALHHAHEAGITHRDLKPGNVMIDLAGEPHIMDFGLAKREVGEVTMTVEGRILGTPAYMPPEQARGEGHKADRRSDLYSLGVILYRLLTGELPFRGSPQMLIMQILRDEPPSPRKLDAHVARDLETICLKCMEKAPESRYQTAAEVRDELRRWLAGEPIIARPISRTERLWRWSKRNPGVAGLTGAVAALLVVIAVGALAAAARLAVARDDAVAARNDAVIAQGKAEDSARVAKAAQAKAEQAEQEAVESAELAVKQKQRADKYAKDALDALNTLVHEVQNQLDDTARTHRLKQQLLEEGLKGLRRVAGDAEFVEDADTILAEAHLKKGELLETLGRIEEARSAFGTSHKIMEKLVAEHPLEVQFKWDLSRAAIRLGSAHALLNDREPARTYCQQALDLRSEIAEVYSGDTIRSSLADAMAQLGDVFRDSEETDQAEQHYRDALEIQRQLAEKASDERQPQRQQAMRGTFDRLGELHFIRLGDPDSATHYYRESLALARAVVEAQPESFRARQQLAVAHEKLGVVYEQQAKTDEANEEFQLSLELLQQLAQEEDPEVLLVQGELALVLARIGRHHEAAERAEHLRTIAPEYVRNLYNVACCYALCATAVQRQVTTASAGQQTERQEYAEKAVRALREAVENGLRSSTYLRIDPDLAAIREHPEFQRIVEQLDTRGDTAPAE